MNTLPKYSDDEVRGFHPVCEVALNNALVNLGLTTHYEVIHHESINGIIPDFVIKNKVTKKYILVVEVKRTPSQVSSTRYRNQAQSYILEAGLVRIEQPYYVLTNLEVSNFFKYDPIRHTSVNNQILMPSPVFTGSFSDTSYEEFLENLTNTFALFIKIAHDDTGQYDLSYDEMLSVLSQFVDNESQWHSAITVLGYEFIRSTLVRTERIQASDWRNATSYRLNPRMLQRTLGTIDFKALTEEPIDISPRPYWESAILKEASKLGERAWDGDEFSSATHDLLIQGREHEGLVPTDEDLAAALVVLSVNDLELNSGEYQVCDPAAGSGNLLSAYITKFPNANPNNIWANDIELLFKDILTIRFGLKFPLTISPKVAPKITSENILSFEKSDFEKVSLVLMNPPYISGVSDPSRKGAYADKIAKITNTVAKTNVGQMPLEGLFLELLIALLRPGTRIGVVFPESHLFAKGAEAVAIRKVLLNDFGLKKVFTYPRTGIFERVSKGTVVLVGEKGIKDEPIETISSRIPLDQLDLHQFELKQDMYGVNRALIPRSKFLNNIDISWKFALFPDYSPLMNLLLNFCVNIEHRYKAKRGRIGSSGGTDYIFPNKLSFWDELSKIVPSGWLIPAIENTKDSSHRDLNSANIEVRGLKAPSEAFMKGTTEYEALQAILDEISSRLVKTKSSQRRDEKSREDIIKILKSASNKVSRAGTILIPRNLRKTFKLFVIREDMYVSSNFIEIIPESAMDRDILISWLSSVYGQIQLEYLAKPQEGARKTELGEIKSLMVPNFNLLSDVSIDKNKIPNYREFVDFSNDSELEDFWSDILRLSDFNRFAFSNCMLEMVSLRNP